MNILYFGTYEKNYPRNRVLIEGLRKNSIKVSECHVPFWENIEDKTGKIKKFSFVIKLHIAHMKLLFKRFKYRNPDLIIVGYIGQLDMLLARICFPKKKIVFNPMISLYDTLVLDRKMIKPKSSLSRLIKYIDKKLFMTPLCLPRITKARDDFGWMPVVTLDKGLEATIDNLRASKGLKGVREALAFED